MQRANHIENRVPSDAAPVQMLGARAGETYSSMVLARPPVQDVCVRAVVSFDDRMAPLVVLAGPLATDCRDAPEYRQHIEIVLFDEGVNVWHHTWTEAGGPAWDKVAWWAFDLAPGTPHELVVERRGPNLSLAVGTAVVAGWRSCRRAPRPHGVRRRKPLLRICHINAGRLNVMEPLLDPTKRIVGSLIEKQITTPDNYPLTLNSLTTACNQKSNRHPVVAFDEKTVVRSLERLRDKAANDFGRRPPC